MPNSNLYVDINVLQTLPPSNANRDDTGAAKTAIYGGVLRARISSQSWKKAMRDDFKEQGINASIRSKNITEALMRYMLEKESDLTEEDAIKKAANVLNASGFKVKFDKKKNKYLSDAVQVVSHGQLEKLAEFAQKNDNFFELLNKKKLSEEDTKELKELKKELKEIGKNNNDALDLALFGRMLADDAELNVEAASQVAHAISTHEIVPDFDYFTAVDDLREKDNSGSAHLGTIEFNSSTLYRYANVNVYELKDNLGSTETVKSVVEFIRSFVKSMPNGYQNSFANKTLPNYVLVCLRDDTPVNLVSAFEEPVKSKDGYVVESIKRLENEYKLSELFTNKPLKALVVSRFNSEVTSNAENLDDLLDKIADVLYRTVQDENNNN